MPSALAGRLTRAHRRELGALGVSVRRQLRQVAAGAAPGDIDAWWREVAGQVENATRRGADLGATLGERYVVRHARAEGASVAAVREVPSLDQIRTSMRVTGPVAFKRHMQLSGSTTESLRVMAETLSGAGLRLALAGARDTVLATINRNATVVGYRRVVRDGGCAFCLMLASRGAVYKRAAAVVGRRGVPRGTREVGDAYHDNCRCTVEPLYEAEPEPAAVARLQERWLRVTAGRSGADARLAWRRAVEAGR